MGNHGQILPYKLPLIMGVIIEYFISLFSRSNNENIIAGYL